MNFRIVKGNRFSITILPSILLFCFIFPPILHAEACRVYNVNFSTDKCFLRSDGIFEIVIQGREHLVSPGSLYSFLVNRFFSEDSYEELHINASELTIEQIEEFIDLSLKDKRVDLALRGLLAYFSNDSSELKKSVELTEKVVSFPVNKEDYQGFIDATNYLYHGHSYRLFPLVYSNVKYFNKNATVFKGSDIEKLNSLGVPKFLFKQIFNLVDKGKTSEANILVDKFKNVMKLNVREVSDFKTLIEQYKALRVSVSNNQVKNFSFNIPKNDILVHEEIGTVFGGIFNNLIVKYSSIYLENYEPERAIVFLSKLQTKVEDYPFKKVEECISQFKMGKFPMPFKSPGISTFLISTAKRDEGVRKAFVRYIRDLIEFNIRKDNFLQIGIYFNTLLIVNPDPSEINDRLRIMWSDAYIEKGRISEGLALLDRTQDSLPFVERLKNKSRYYYYAHPFILGILVTLFAICLLGAFGWYSYSGLKTMIVKYLEWRKHHSLFKGDASSKSAEDQENSEEEFEAFQNFKQDFDLNSPLILEYKKMLDVLELDPSADLKDIKKAYRVASKQYHPDTGTDASSDKFIEVGEAYEFLMEIEQEGLITPEQRELLIHQQ